MSSSEKDRLRAEALAKRDALAKDERAAAADLIATQILAFQREIGQGPLSGFWPIRSEVDPRPAMIQFAERGVALALPVVTGAELVFRLWRPGEELARGPFGLSEPFADAPSLDPIAMLVPLAAFDRRGHRIGYGAGFYDRAIARLAPKKRPFTIGIAFAVQEIAAVPDEVHDQPLDRIVTERETIIPSR